MPHCFTTKFFSKMTIEQVADRLIALASQGKFEQAQRELFAADAVSIEPDHAVDMGMTVRTEGLPAIIEKGKHWQAYVEQFFGSNITGPVIAGDHFSIAFSMDIKYQGRDRQTDAEICVYQVKNGKVVKEQFFY